MEIALVVICVVAISGLAFLAGIERYRSHIYRIELERRQPPALEESFKTAKGKLRWHLRRIDKE